MPTWKRRVYKLDANHTWKAKPGYQIFVADWGAVRFDIPSGWAFDKCVSIVPGMRCVSFLVAA